MSCPIHGGDNPSALNLYHGVDGNYDYSVGNWVCRTHHCEKIFQPSIIGFMRGILSVSKMNWQKAGDEMYPFSKTVELALKILKKDFKDINVSNINKEKNNFSRHIHTISTPDIKHAPSITRVTIRNTLNIPSQYYLDRGFSSKILDKYDVGLCSNPKKEMFNRVVVPIYNQDYTNMVGCTGRSIYNKCDKCGYFHNPKSDCVTGKYAWKYSKWKHNKDFKSKDHLYNLWFAKKHIIESGVAIIVESPGNVWKLEQAGIHNSVAIFGTSMSDRQKMLLDCSGAMSIIIALDPDEAGLEGGKKITEKCSRTYNTKTIDCLETDIGEMKVKDIQNIIKPEIGKLHV
jgi:5S rRNA maturation endonuclease (ribonuclease M5)